MFSVTPRLRLLQLALFAFVGILICRLLYLQVIKYQFYVEKSQNQINKSFTIYPNRGEIYDRNHIPLAFSCPVFSMYAIPTQVKNKRQ
ncbi:penicillin-binding protein 2, partial [bacterium]|nr:penicillin-binding protein 2 [bacterium]